jgi:hypothetical protein
MWQDAPTLNSAYAVPYIFEPIPIPGEEGLEPHQLEPMLHGEGPDAESLAAMWCLLEKEGQGLPDAGPSGLPVNDGAGLFGWNVSGEQAAEQWSHLEGE